MAMRYFRDEDRNVFAVENEQEAEAYAADATYTEIDKAEFDDCIDSDPWRPQ